MPSENKQPGFAIFRGKGFHMTFANGHTVSVQFGPGNYCGEYPNTGLDFDAPAKAVLAREDWTSHDAEVASWNRKGQWTTQDYFKDCGDDVKGYVSPDEVQGFIAWAASQPATN